MGIGPYETREAKPGQKLVDLMKSETGAEMDAKMMRLFLKANWKKVSLYAHSIHGSEPDCG